MSKKCCGSQRESMFCPDCGKRLRESSDLVGLLVHCRKQAAHYKRDVERSETDREFATSEYLKRTHKRDTATYAKWQGWADSLQAVLDAK